MKHILLFATFLFVTLFLKNDASAQTVNTWKGGFPGHETEWSCAKNWSLNHVPAEFDRVVVPDVSTTTGRSPIARTGFIQIDGLEIQSNATLTLASDVKILLTNEFINSGKCTGCEVRILIEGLESAGTASAKD